VASSATLVSTTPIFVALFSYFILKERPSRSLKLGVLCTVLGSAFLAARTIRSPELPSWRPPGYPRRRHGLRLSPRRPLRQGASQPRRLHPGSVRERCLNASHDQLPSEHPLSGFSGETYFFLALIALFPQLIGHTAFNWALRFLSQRESPFSSLENPSAQPPSPTWSLEKPSPPASVWVWRFLLRDSPQLPGHCLGTEGSTLTGNCPPLRRTVILPSHWRRPFVEKGRDARSIRGFIAGRRTEME